MITEVKTFEISVFLLLSAARVRIAHGGQEYFSDGPFLA